MSKSKNNGYWPKPDFTKVVKTNKDYQAAFQSAMSYAHMELTPADFKKEVVKYLKALDPKHPFIERVKDMNENRVAGIGKYMYILNNGGNIPDEILPTLMPQLEKNITGEEARISTLPKKKIVDTKDEEKAVVSIQDRLKDRAVLIAADIEGWLDDFCLDKKSKIKEVEDVVNLFKINELKSAHMRHIQNIFESRAAEIALVVDGSDKELNEGYLNFTKAELKKLDQFYKNILKAVEMLQDAAKVDRAPRKKKSISLDKLVARLKYKKEDTSLGIVSLNPVQILGAKELWVYNTKTRKLAQYKASNESGLGVKGASLTDFSTESLEKTLRKPAETLADFKKASKVKLRTFLKDLSTVDVNANGKINEHHIILRVDK